MSRDGTRPLAGQMGDSCYDLADNRCESVTGGGRYRCMLAKGHEGKHSHLFTAWNDVPPAAPGRADD